MGAALSRPRYVQSLTFAPTESLVDSGERRVRATFKKGWVSMKRMWQAALGIGASLLLVLAGTTAANASEGDREYADNGSPIIEAEGIADPQVVAALEARLQPLVEATSGSEFDAAAAVRAGADEQDVADFAVVYEAKGGNVIGAAEAGPSTAAMKVATVAAACVGADGYTGFWPTGYQWALNSCNTAQLISLVGLGAAGAAGVTALLAYVGAPQGAALTAIVGSVIGAGAAFLITCQAFSSNGGIYLNAGQGTVIPPSCWGQ